VQYRSALWETVGSLFPSREQAGRCVEAEVGGVGQSALVLFQLNPHQCAEMCSEIAEPVHKRVDEYLPEKERVGDSEWKGDCSVLALQKVVVECVGRSATRRPMTKWDSIAANRVHGKAPSGRRMHVKRSM
jgi:hypothetical protein